MKGSIETITGLLLGAAYADKRLEGREIDQIRSLLLRLLGSEELPNSVADQIASFNPAMFDAPGAAASLIDLEERDRTRILEMVAAVHDADDEVDLAEDEYLVVVAKGLGVSAAGLTIQFQELDGSLGDEAGNHEGDGDGPEDDAGGGYGDAGEAEGSSTGGGEG